MMKIQYVLAVAVALGPGPLRAQAPAADSVVTFRGIVMRDTGSSWGLFLPVPAQVGHVRFNFLHIVGKPGAALTRTRTGMPSLRGQLQADDAGATRCSTSGSSS